jgi:hypothetical protein
MNLTPQVDVSTSMQDDLNDILASIGFEHRLWLVELWARFSIRQEPITAFDGRVVAEPLFWFEKDKRCIACFGSQPIAIELQVTLQESKISILEVGEVV